MSEQNIVLKIVEQRKKDIARLGFSFGHKIPQKRTRPVTPFMQNKGVILEVKRASPSKGDIAPNLDSAATATAYCQNGASAISCLTEENYFKGTLEDLQKVCAAVDKFSAESGKPAPAVLRKDFLIDEEEIEIAYRCGADAVLLICGILPLEKLLCMAERCKELGIRALVEVRTKEDVQKALELKKQFADTIVCGVNSRNLKDFTIDLLVPCQLKAELGGSVIFESGITTAAAAAKIGSMGFKGILLGEFAARNPKKAGEFVKAFENSKEDLSGKKWLEYAQLLNGKKLPLVKICGLTRAQDVLLADQLGAAFVGFIFATEFERNVYGQRFEQIKQILPKVKAFKVAVVTRPQTPEAKAAAQLVKEGVLDFVQLHGIKYNEVPDYLMEVPHYFAVTGKSVEETGQLFAYGEPRFLQDDKSHSYKSTDHLWLAGGVTAENVTELINEFKPELIDVSSGIEAEQKGVKSEEKMKFFFERVKAGVTTNKLVEHISK